MTQISDRQFRIFATKQMRTGIRLGCCSGMKLTVAVGVLFLLLCSFSEAQQSARIPHIGFQLDTPTASTATRIEAFRQGLRDLGYLEGKNIIIEWRSSEGKLERRSEIAAELVRLKVDVIVSAGPTVTRVLKEVTSTIPIVMAQDPDALGSGFVASLARPGENITGLGSLSSE